MSESTLQRDVLNYLKLVPGIVFGRSNSGLIKTSQGQWVHLLPKGWPDITGHLPDGRALYIELKDPTRKPSRDNAKRRATIAAQEAFIADAARKGCVAFRATSVDEVADRIREEVGA